MLTIGQASLETGKTKTAISNAIKSGKISANRNANGSYIIDPSELFRLYPKKDTKLDLS
jgi:hypothetical protein